MSTEAPEVAVTKSLVLVVGAGASKEVGLPTGEELKEAIAKALNFRVVRGGYDVDGGDRRILSAIRRLTQSSDGGDINSYLRAAWQIRDAMPQAPSIDNFIDAHRGDRYIEACAKLAIVACLLKAEAGSRLRVDRSNINNKIDFSAVAATWFNEFFKLISYQRDALPDRLRKVAIVCFNYDRCIGHFLHESLKNYYSLPSREAADLLSGLEIYHPYGTVGSLPWSCGEMGIDFGKEPEWLELLDLSKKIRTFTEGTDTSASDILAIRAVMRSAQVTAFLGFAFHRLNIQLLYGDSQSPNRGGRVYGTVLGMSESNTACIVEELCTTGGFAKKSIVLRDFTASHLVRDYSRSFSSLWS